MFVVQALLPLIPVKFLAAKTYLQKGFSETFGNLRWYDPALVMISYKNMIFHSLCKKPLKGILFISFVAI